MGLQPPPPPRRPISSLSYYCQYFNSGTGRIQFDTNQSFDSIIIKCLCWGEYCSTNSSPFNIFSLLTRYNWLLDSIIWQCNLFQISFDVGFAMSVCLQGNFGTRWMDISCPEFCQVALFATTSWEPPYWNVRFPVSVICEFYLWKSTLSNNSIYFLSFWLTRRAGSKQKIFAVNVEGQWRKNYRPISAKIVAIWSPPLFFEDIGSKLWAEVS